jgi:hypothetical protein
MHKASQPPGETPEVLTRLVNLFLADPTAALSEILGDDLPSFLGDADPAARKAEEKVAGLIDRLRGRLSNDPEAAGWLRELDDALTPFTATREAAVLNSVIRFLLLAAFPGLKGGGQ